MRTSPILGLVALGLALVLAAPAATASTSTLKLEARATESGGTIPIDVHLLVEDILCSEERTFTVTIEVASGSDATGTLDATTVSFPVEARSYFVTPFEAQGSVNLTASGEGTIELMASFSAEEGVCFAPGGIPPATTTLVVDIGAADPATPPEEPVEPTPTEPTPEEPAPPTPEEPAEPTPEESTSPTPSQSGNQVCAPETSCGYIGDYDGNRASESTRDAPGLGVVAAIAVFGVIAIALRARKG